MKEYDIRRLKRVRLMGRYDKDEPGFHMTHSGSLAEMRVKGSRLDVEIEAGYDSLRHYLSFVVDGLVAQTFSPIPGKHVYTVFLNMDANKTHDVTIIKETMDFDGSSFVTLHKLITDGAFMPLRKREMKIEFIGDSITAGEGVRGPKPFNEWMPMMFCSLNDYAHVAADKLHARFQTVAMSGWGIHNAWNNELRRNVPAIYDQIGNTVNKPYDFSFDPDAVVIALGTNDNGSLKQKPFTDENGVTFALHDDEEGRRMIYDSALSFIRHLHEVNPRARLLWLSFHTEGMVHDAIRSAVTDAAGEGIDIRFDEPIDLNHMPRGGIGSRMHPGPAAQKIIADRVVKLLK